MALRPTAFTFREESSIATGAAVAEAAGAEVAEAFRDVVSSTSSSKAVASESVAGGDGIAIEALPRLSLLQMDRR
eukprot:CAMPEP_0171376134 /NCGR_PEP_ID=MMETSP0879-20121228/18182_1 /TAXON_ID=67004 /ORGANISM="Thalassiosira weissflogii, Strain CCMP1336" /LENGTH=74 /DNA_ID=CAMNT_0011885915 /DNA_START=59 /DNA_END=280 /DNA_ORIENTATION=-